MMELTPEQNQIIHDALKDNGYKIKISVDKVDLFIRQESCWIMLDAIGQQGTEILDEEFK